MPYKAKGQCVYNADTGKKVGCTKGPVKKYLAALHANVPDAKNESQELCRQCGGDGWYVDGPTEHPQQRQCDACQGDGKIGPDEEPEVPVRDSGEPVFEIKAVSYNGGLPPEEPCKMCGSDLCKCMHLSEIIKKMR